MALRTKSLILVLSGLLIAGILGVILVSSQLCGSRAQGQEKSPSGDFLASLEESDCGAASGFETEVVLTESRARLGLPLLGHRRDTVLTLSEASTHLRLYWESPVILVIACQECRPEDVHIWMKSWRQVSIRYAFKIKLRALTTEYLYSDSRADTPGKVMPFHDALGSTVALVDASGNIATAYSYDPFGGTTSLGLASSNPAQYTGRENEGNGLYFYRNRYYEQPSTKERSDR